MSKDFFSLIMKLTKAKHSRYIMVGFTLTLTLLGMWLISIDAKSRYEAILSPVIYDRHYAPLSIQENSKGHYVSELLLLPEDFKKLLLRKEDRFFYYHLGISLTGTYLS